jgi:hypothetical protein
MTAEHWRLDRLQPRLDPQQWRMNESGRIENAHHHHRKIRPVGAGCEKRQVMGAAGRICSLKFLIPSGRQDAPDGGFTRARIA